MRCRRLADRNIATSCSRGALGTRDRYWDWRLDPGTHSGVYSATMPSQALRPRDLARTAGVSTDTLRHYERLGILGKPPRTPGNYRSYPPDAVARLALIRNALAVGFTLRELTDILRERDAGGAPCKRVAALAVKKIGLVDTQIAELRRLKDLLKRRVRSWNTRLESTPSGVRAFLLERPRVHTRRSSRKAMQ